MVLLAFVRLGLASGQRFSSADWRIEKHTINLHSSTGLEVHNWISRYLCTPKTSRPSDLGCGNLRVWCEIASPYTGVEWKGHTFELHWVDAPSLNDFVNSSGNHDNDAWIEYLDGLNRPQLEFNPFSHNKVQLYVRDLALYLERFIVGNVTHSKRWSLDKTGARVAHVGFNLAGRIYELVGSPVDDVKEWTHWSQPECSAAHELEDSLKFYEDMAERAYPSSLGFGFGEMLVVGISMSFHDPLGKAQAAPAKSIATLYDHLEILAGARIQKRELTSKTCSIAEIRFDSMPGLVTRYVKNDSPQLKTLPKNIEDYDSYAAALHAQYSLATSSKYDGEWYGWDHMLDQHIGLWYGGTFAPCLQRSASARKLLRVAQLGVGERGEPDAHEMYVGYAGSMAWEYQWHNCNSSRPFAPAECACIATNNLDEYMMKFNETSCVKHQDRRFPILV